MYAVTSIPFDKRTRAIFRRAELGFLGVIVRTWVQTPRFCGEPLFGSIRPFRALKLNRNAGALVFDRFVLRPLRTN
jgi:hypothetical protein